MCLPLSTTTRHASWRKARREVFLLTAGMLRSSDDFFRLFASKLQTEISENLQIVSLLRCVSAKDQRTLGENLDFNARISAFGIAVAFETVVLTNDVYQEIWNFSDSFSRIAVSLDEVISRIILIEHDLGINDFRIDFRRDSIQTNTFNIGHYMALKFVCI